MLNQEIFGISYYYILLFSLFGLFFIVSFFYRKYKKENKKSHKWRRKSAIKALNKIKEINNPSQIFSYLRKVDPFVFEEMILYSINSNNKNVKIQKSRRYTGDGGADGTFWIDRKKYLIQAKRYSNYINKQHVEEFYALVIKEKAYGGLFVHTGKTGSSIKNLKNTLNEKNIKIISGDKLITLLFEGKF